MQIEFNEIGHYIGELCAAAHHDYVTADQSDVGLNGMHIASWRQAYWEGCKDMADGILTRVPEAHRDELKEFIRAVFSEEFDKLKNAKTEAA